MNWILLTAIIAGLALIVACLIIFKDSINFNDGMNEMSFDSESAKSNNAEYR